MLTDEDSTEPTCRRMKSGPYLTPATESRSEWTTGRHVGPTAVPLLEGKAEVRLLDLSRRLIFGDDTEA